MQPFTHRRFLTPVHTDPNIGIGGSERQNRKRDDRITETVISPPLSRHLSHRPREKGPPLPTLTSRSTRIGRTRARRRHRLLRRTSKPATLTARPMLPILELVSAPAVSVKRCRQRQTPSGRPRLRASVALGCVLVGMLLSAGSSSALGASRAAVATGSFSISLSGAVSEDGPAIGRAAGLTYLNSTGSGSGAYTLGPSTPWIGGMRYIVTHVSGTITITNHFQGSSATETITVKLAGSGWMVAKNGQGSVLSLNGTATDTGGVCRGAVEVGFEPASTSEVFSLTNCGGNASGGLERWTKGGISMSIGAGGAPAKPSEPVTNRATWLVSHLRVNPRAFDSYVALVAINGHGTADLTAAGKVVSVNGSIVFLAAGGDLSNVVTIDLKPIGGTYTHSGSRNTLVFQVRVTNLRTSAVECIADPEGTVTLIDGVASDELRISSVCGIKALLVDDPQTKVRIA